MSPLPLRSSVAPALVVTLSPLMLMVLLGGADNAPLDGPAVQLPLSAVEPKGRMSPAAETDVRLPLPSVTAFVCTKAGPAVPAIKVEIASGKVVGVPTMMLPSGAQTVP